MIKYLSTSLLVILIGTGFSASAQQEFKTTSTSVIGYLEYLPDGYHNTSRNYPVLIFLHGINESGPNTSDPKKLERASKRLMKHGPPKYIKKGTKFPFIVITPQLKYGRGNWHPGYVMEVVEHVKKTLRVDNSRIYLTGLSLGGGGAWTVAQEYPKVFAAVAPICGGFNSTQKAKGIADTDLPVWAFHGDRDRVVPVSRSQRMIDAINSYNPNPNARISVYPGVGHNAWENAYRPDHSIHSQNLYEWLLSFTNNDNPKPTPNILPVASAGNNIAFPESQKAYVLKGSGSDKDGKIVSYLWEKVAGSVITMRNEKSAVLTILGYKPGTYSFRLTVTDDVGAKGNDIIEVKVQPAPSLTVFAGPDVQTTSNQIAIKGSGKAQNAKIVSYEWRQTSGKSVTLKDEKTPKLKVFGLTPGKYSFRLTAKDDHSTSVSDEMELTVKAKKKRKELIVNAGKDIKVSIPINVVHLRGSAFSRNSKVIAALWVQVSGKPVKIHIPDKLHTPVSEIHGAGTRAFKLIIQDELGRVTVDHVRLYVVEPRTKSSASNDSTIIVEKVVLPTDTNNDFDLNSGQEWDQKLTVFVYNDRGDKLYQGPWKEDSYHNIFVRSGFYIYQVWDRSRRIYTGKLIIR